MRAFMDQDFLLSNETAVRLFHDYAEKMPIYDYHNHLEAKEIYEDKKYDNLTEVWLGGDHYKWRAMRAFGIPEEKITGNAEPYEKFAAWVQTLENAMGNPLYHWSHLELQRYFGVMEALTSKNCKEIWEICNKKLREPGFTVRGLLKMQNVKVLCTTNDPAEDLEWHKKLREEDWGISVYPTFRPDGAMNVNHPSYAAYLEKLEQLTKKKIAAVEALVEALEERLDFFVKEAGCRIADHSLEERIYVPCELEEAEEIFTKRGSGTLSGMEVLKFKSYLLQRLGVLYHERGMVMQLHIGAMRNNSGRMFERLGANTGFDSIDDVNYAREISAFLNKLDQKDQLPKTILYCLNIKDYDMLSAVCGNFQSAPYRGKVQFGPAWWFCDNRDGMEKQMKSLANQGLLSVFVGMLTDSRSFLSFPRHEYFRRILCNLVGTWVENGEFPADMEYLEQFVENICYNNIENYILSDVRSSERSS